MIHIHDWHAVPALLHREGALGADPAIGRAAFLLSVHNLAYHGWTPAANVAELGLGAIAGPGGAGKKDGIDLLLAGIERADLVNTVSPGFAAEALGPEMGMGLDGALRARGDEFFGILNGLDTDLWDPATDAALPAGYSRADRSGKASCRAGLLEEIGLDPADPRPVLAMVGRLDRQKGFDLLAEATPALLDLGFRLAVLGSGNHDVVAPLRAVAASRAGRGMIALMERFDRDLARRLYAGADGFLMPSRFEPCGTGQMVALRYGTPPIVHATGGLRDTVIDVDADPVAGTGFAFEAETSSALLDACRRFLTRFTAAGSSLGSPARPRHGRRLRLANRISSRIPRCLPTCDCDPPIYRDVTLTERDANPRASDEACSDVGAPWPTRPAGSVHRRPRRARAFAIGTPIPNVGICRNPEPVRRSFLSRVADFMPLGPWSTPYRASSLPSSSTKTRPRPAARPRCPRPHTDTGLASLAEMAASATRTWSAFRQP